MKIEAIYEISSPLFMRGADPSGSLELRPASFKGLLRFWFRAVAFCRLGSVKGVLEEENKLFGSKSGQSRVSLTINPINVSLGNLGKLDFGLRYLGYGLLSKSQKNQAIKHGTRVELILNIKDLVGKEELSLLEKSLCALGTFGGAGARSRRGFGSLTLVYLIIDGKKYKSGKEYKSKEDLKNFICKFLKAVIGKNNNTLPPYTAFSGKTQVFIGEASDNPIELLEKIGQELKQYRMSFKNKEIVEKVKKKVIFGLSSPYKLGESTVKIVSESSGNRRASPLFIHIHKVQDNKYVPVFTVFPAQFLPRGAWLQIDNQRERITINEQDFKVISEFLRSDSLNAQEVCKNE